MIEELITRAFTRRDQAHLAHWATKSYSEHMALDEFYNDVIDAIDSITENYQAYFGLVPSVSISKYETPSDILSLLKEDVKWINKNRSKIAQDVPSIENLIDELTSVYTKAIYKLTNLK